eukprot:SAG22_NODE_10040_length_556_cov_1.446389_1_plen_134_part_00
MGLGGFTALAAAAAVAAGDGDDQHLHPRRTSTAGTAATATLPPAGSPGYDLCGLEYLNHPRAGAGAPTRNCSGTSLVVSCPAELADCLPALQGALDTCCPSVTVAKRDAAGAPPAAVGAVRPAEAPLAPAPAA